MLGLGWPGAQPFFFKGGIPRLSPAWDFLVTRAAASFIEGTDDPHHPIPSASLRGRLFLRSARKG